MNENKVEELKQKTIKKCEETGVNFDGVQKLICFYMDNLFWNEEKAYEYALQLFENGTIQTLMDMVR